MFKKIIAIDLLPAEYRAKELGMDFFPLSGFRDVVSGQSGDTDVLEILVPLVRKVPENDSPEALATVTNCFERKRHALQMNGATVIEAPAKRSQSTESSYKQSDDQRLVITTLSMCLRLRPDFLTLVAADGDFSPMVEELRREGIRTEVVASAHMLASDLKKVAWNVIDLDNILENLRG
ncbi:NYN domain-containing protein [Desulfobacter latus]|uniref:NYN domain-containing protein n=1 Tax=Desulfobacter latus TaxID=2292 RepID=A0A850T3V6_9BACT|nr:NYN domain-containing protein [Desulfobacter latus]NWH06443.1 NYN domain-containing protein [Desulfobacter latus]